MSLHTDIVTTGWIAKLPRGWVPFALLARFDRPIGAWLLFLPGLWAILLSGSPFWPSIRFIALFFVGAVLMRGAGCVVNDMWDRDMDRLVTRTAGRPLASGAVRVRGAAVFLMVLLMASLLILLQLSPLAQALGVCSLLLVALYPAAKRVTWWPQLMLGFTFGWGAPMGYAAANGSLGGTALTLYAASIVWILGYDTVYAHQDREDDALIGVRSTARLFGHRSRWFVGVCYIIMIMLLCVAGWSVGESAWFFAAMLLPAGLLAWQVFRLDIHDPAQCLRLFKANREVGLAVAMAILLGRF